MEPVRFGTEDGVSLEGELRHPETPPVGSAVICHAHPRHGGSKDHPILWALRNELASRGFVVLAFNFRGTMRSAGTYGAGHTETKDVAAAIGRVREEAEGPTIVCGWSFGANVALREALTDERVGALALIGLPLEPADIEIPPTPRTVRAPGVSRVPPCCSPARGTSTARGRALEALGADDAEGRGGHRAGHRPLPVAPREGGRGDGRGRSRNACCSRDRRAG